MDNVLIFKVRWFLEHIVLDVGEEPVSNELVESIVRLAEIHADVMATQDEASIQLEEESQLQLPFLLPQDGYSPGFVSFYIPHIYLKLFIYLIQCPIQTLLFI